MTDQTPTHREPDVRGCSYGMADYGAPGHDGGTDVHQPHPALPPDEARLLRTYADGPRIWDAAAVFEVVMRLSDKGLIAPSGLSGAYALTAAGRQALPANPPQPRRCLYVFETSLTEHGYIPSMVTEGEPGHALMSGNGEHAAPWYWGHDLSNARAIAEKSNKEMGLSPIDVIDILASSHHASQQR